MQLQHKLLIVTMSAGLVTAVACSSSDESPGSSTGGATGSGALPGSGGAPANGGSANGGAAPTGGSVSTGGSLSTGGIGAGGGPQGSGGGFPTGGTTGTGGDTTMGGTTASGGTTATGGSGNGGTTSTGSLCLKAGSGDYTKNGPYAFKRTTVDLKDSGTLAANAAAPTTATIFAPTELEANCKHPVVAWGNGTTVTGPDVYAFFNELAASWGVIVIAADNSNAASANYQPAALDYMAKQNTTSGSPFFGKLSGRNGTAGHSQGAIAATTSSSHASVQAEVQVQGGGKPKAGIAFLALTGSNDTVVGTTSPKNSYNQATGPSMFANYTGADHTTTPTLGGAVQNNPGTIQYKRFYAAWFRCFLADDETACKMFKGGANCGVCKDPNWTELVTKGM